MKTFKSIKVILVILLSFGIILGEGNKNIHLILALDDSGSMKKSWKEAQAAVFSIIDQLEIGDLVYPIAFSTYARLLSTPIRINGVSDKATLREIYEKLKPTGQWTYFRDLINLCEEILKKDSSAMLICITDAISDPGPGRVDIDITKLTEIKEKFPGGVYVLRLISDKNKIDNKIRQTLQEEQKVLKEGGVISVIVVDEKLIQLCGELISALREVNRTTLKLLEEKYSSIIDIVRDSMSKKEISLFQDSSEKTHKYQIPDSSSAKYQLDTIKKILKSTKKNWLDSLFVKKALVGKKFLKQNWWLLLIISLFFVITIIFIRILNNLNKKRNVLREDKESKKVEEIVNPEIIDKEELFIIVKSPNLFLTYPLRKNEKVSLGTDIPLDLEKFQNVGTIFWDKEGSLYFEPSTDNRIFLNNEPLKIYDRRVNLKVGDFLTFDNTYIFISSTPTFDFKFESFTNTVEKQNLNDTKEVSEDFLI